MMFVGGRLTGRLGGVIGDCSNQNMWVFGQAGRDMMAIHHGEKYVDGAWMRKGMKPMRKVVQPSDSTAG